MNLTTEQIAVREKFTRQINARPNYYLAQYRRRFGKILDADKAKELSADYRRSKESRARLAAAVHGPAGDLVWRLWKVMLAEPDPLGSNSVLLTAGGMGSGKTSAISAGTGPLTATAQIIYDTSLSHWRWAEEKVEMALAAGKLVYVIYVHRPVELAVAGVIERALREGRTVPARLLADFHFDAQRTLIKLARRYESQARVWPSVLDNSGQNSPAQFVPQPLALDFLRKGSTREGTP